MALGDVANGVPAYSIWFGSSGVLATLAGILAGRDGAVRQAWQEKYELGLARLNEHLSKVARLAHTITVGQSVVYNTIRDENDFHELRELVMHVRSTTFWPAVTRLITRSTVFVVALHVAAGLTMVALVVNDVVGSDASDTYNAAVWSSMTAVAVALLIGKAVIYLVKGG